MTIKFYKKVASTIFLILFIVIIICPISGAKWFEESFSNVKTKMHNFIVFNFEIISPLNYNFLSGDEFVTSADVEKYVLSIQYIPDNVTLSYVNLTLKSPNNEYYYFQIKNTQWISNDSNRALVFYVPLGKFPLKFNESGAWYLTFYFKTNSNVWIWESMNGPFKLNENSRIRTVYTYGDYNYYKKGITVYTVNELASLRAAIAAENTANQYSNSLIILLITAIAATFTAVFSLYSVNETLKGKRIESVKHMIQGALVPAIREFKEFEESLLKINDGKIINLPKHLESSIIETSQWKDFEIEFGRRPGRKKVKQYLEKKDIYKKLKQEIKDEIIRNIGIKRKQIPNFYQFLTNLKKKYNISKTPIVFFNEDIINGLAKSILHKEANDSDYTKELFNEYNEDWISIRDEVSVSEKMTAILEHINNMKYRRVAKTLEQEKDAIMAKYNLRNWELEEHVRKLMHEEFVQPTFSQEFEYITSISDK